MILLILCIIFVLLVLYKRYMPVTGISEKSWKDFKGGHLSVVDVREYNESVKSPIDGSINIPVGYLKRYMGEITGKSLHLIVSSSLERNISIRILRKNGYQINSYTIINDSCSNLKNNHINIHSTC